MYSEPTAPTPRGPDGYDIVRPDPAGTIRSLTSLGYSPEAAVADLIDNSIAAGASLIRLVFHWGGGAGSSVGILDDGRGMSEAELTAGMTIGARGMATDRDTADLGRFGMGLKTASFSQCRQLVVATRQTADGPWVCRTWDIDHVLQCGEWRLLRGVPEEAQDDLERLTQGHDGPGTLVLWRRLTRLSASGSSASDEWAQKEFHSQIATIEGHLGMVFGRYLTRRRTPLALTVNGQSVEPWDPFLSANPYVDRLAPEEPVKGVTVRGFVLPHRSRLNKHEAEAAGGPRGWLDQQGFYVYRKDRLIVSGGWLNLGFRKDERHVLARIAVDVPAEQDEEWSVDIRKSSATPPPALVNHLRRLAKATRERAGAVMVHRGRGLSGGQASVADATWQQVSKFGRTSFRLNRDHPLVMDLQRRHPEMRSGVTALLNIIEETLPVGLIRVTPSLETEDDTVSGVIPEVVLQMAGQVLEALISQGNSPDAALVRLTHMPPFHEYSDLEAHLLRPGP